MSASICVFHITKLDYWSFVFPILVSSFMLLKAYYNTTPAWPTLVFNVCQCNCVRSTDGRIMIILRMQQLLHVSHTLLLHVFLTSPNIHGCVVVLSTS